MARRKPVSTRTRFEVFKRDAFTCQYCGGKPPAAILHIDHITPVSAGGTNDLANLVTSCKDCNLGKSDVLLSDTRPIPNRSSILELREAREQLEAYQEYLIGERKAREVATTLVLREIERRLGFAGGSSEHTSVMTILKELPYPEALDAVDVTERRDLRGYQAWKYFCGVAWTKIKAIRNRVTVREQLGAHGNEQVN